MTTTTKREFIKLGYSMWKTKGKDEWYYITAHLCPMSDADKMEGWGASVHMICSCKDFTIGIAAKQGNVFETPCKHIRDFDEGEVDIEELERGSTG